ncbi:amidohydrolase [Thalassotalea maritima]|uniref:amidohydrolase n=1 Tax=Thalassotalea maritima TaxID=3242416 RepID=UPI00352910EE
MTLFNAICLSALLASNLAHAATTVIENINGYTMENGKLVRFHAIQFTDDIIDTVYKDQQAVVKKPTFTVIDGANKTMLPGLIDAHGHVLSYGQSLLQADLVNSESAQIAAARVNKYAMKNSQLSWLLGRGWNQEQWPSKQFPSAATLDSLIADRPVVLQRIDGHAIWVNSKAMQMAGVNADTKDIDGGEIIRDSDGKPTGVFIDNAMDLVYRKIPQLSMHEQQYALKTAMQDLARQGLTSVHDAGIDSNNIQAFKSLNRNNDMLIRVNAMLGAFDADWHQHLKLGPYYDEQGMLQINSVKISADGALGSRGAALLADYTDKPHHRGLLLHNEEQLKQLIQTSMQAGFQVNTHAIGDRANKLVLDHYQTLIEQTNSQALRHRIEHAQVLQLADLQRFSEHNIIASMQATHATSDKNMAEDRLGSERIRGAYAWRSLLDKGVIIASGSDFPVEPANPFFGLHAAVTRQDRDDQPSNGWYANERMDLIEAFNSFTMAAAYAGHQEHLIGSLEAGKKADFIFIDQDIFSIDKQNIWRTKVLATYINGKKLPL